MKRRALLALMLAALLGWAGPLWAQSTVATTTDQYMAGIPQVGGKFKIDDTYFVLYPQSGELRVKYGPSLDSLTDGFTDGASNVSGLANSGRAIAIEAGTDGGTEYIYAALCFTTGTDRLQLWRWEPTVSGLGTPTKLLGGQGTRDFNTATLNVDSAAGEVYWGGNDFNANAQPNRSATTGMGSNAGEFDVGPSLTSDAEQALMVRLADGYAVLHNDQGQTGDNAGGGHFREWRKAALGNSWGAEQTIEGSLFYEFAGQWYSLNSSHTGQGVLAQLPDLRTLLLFVNDTDATNGDQGRVLLNVRGNQQASDWANVSIDVAKGGLAWHVGMSILDGVAYLFWLPDEAGSRGSAIYYRTYNPTSERFGPVTKLADITSGRTFNRMTMPHRSTGGEVVVAWDEDHGDGNYSLMVDSVTPAGETFTLTEFKSAIRAELATELARIDEPVSTATTYLQTNLEDEAGSGATTALVSLGIATAADVEAARGSLAQSMTLIPGDVADDPDIAAGLTGITTISGQMPAGGATVAAAGATATTLDDVSGGDGVTTPFLNKRPAVIVRATTRADRTKVDRTVRMVAGERTIVALQIWAQGADEDWLDSMASVPVSSDAATVAVIDTESDEAQWGVNRDWALFTLSADASATAGTTGTVKVTVSPEEDEVRVIAVPWEVIE